MIFLVAREVGKKIVGGFSICEYFTLFVRQ